MMRAAGGASNGCYPPFDADSQPRVGNRQPQRTATGPILDTTIPERSGLPLVELPKNRPRQRPAISTQQARDVRVDLRNRVHGRRRPRDGTFTVAGDCRSRAYRRSVGTVVLAFVVAAEMPCFNKDMSCLV
jgi:hypothetical protein